jgi:hypothetical protein
MGKKTKNIIDRYLSFLEKVALKIFNLPQYRKYVLNHKLRVLGVGVLILNLIMALHIGIRGYCITCTPLSVEEKIKYKENPDLLLKLWADPIFVPYEDFYTYMGDALSAMALMTTILLIILSIFYIGFRVLFFLFKKIEGKIKMQ